MIIIDYRDRRPLYEQITEQYRLLILQGLLPTGEKMPSVRDLSVQLSINPNTVQRAYAELERQGLIYPVKGKGNFVSDVQGQKRFQEEFLGKLHELCLEGQKLGVTEKEMKACVHACFDGGDK